MPIRTEQGLRQVLAPECLADIVTNTPYSYTISFYHRSDVFLVRDPVSGLYLLADINAIVAYTIENPAESAEDYNTLRITEVRTSKSVTNEYAWADRTGWTLSRGNALVVESEVETTNASDRIVVRQVANASSVVASEERCIYRTFAWGERLIEKVVDTGGAALTTTYSYYDDPNDPGSYGHLQERTEPGGGWARYGYDAQGRLAWEQRPYGDDATNTVLSEYTRVDDNDTLAIEAIKPRTITETVGDDVVRKTFHAYWLEANGEGIEIVEECAALSAEYGDSGNRRTVRTYYGQDPQAATFGPLKTVQYPDGRMDTYTYTNGNYTTYADPASNRFDAASGGDYKQTVVIHATTNQPQEISVQTTEDRTVEDLFGRTVLNEQHLHTDGAPARIRWTVTSFDELGRPAETRSSDGTETETGWACCGKEWETAASGIMTSYTYDDLKRVLTSTRGTDLVTSYTYDPAGRVLSTTRYAQGTGLSLATSNRYDLAGRLTNSVDESGLETTYAYAEGGRITTQTLPGDATRITENYPDGRTKSVTGTAVVPQYYTYGAEADGTQWTKVSTGPAGASSPMWSKTVTDLLGHTIREERTGLAGEILTKTYQYNGIGQLVKMTSPGMADTVYQYDELGRQIRQGRVEGGVTNWLSGSEQAYETPGSEVWQVLRSLAFPEDNDTAVTTSVQRTQLTGLGTSGDSGILAALSVAEDIHGNQTTNRTWVDRSNKTATQVVDYPDSDNDAVSVTSNGLPRFSTSKTGVRTDYAYDALGHRGQPFTIHFTDDRILWHLAGREVKQSALHG